MTETLPPDTDCDFRSKYESRNPLARVLIDGFYASARVLVREAAPQSVLEIGCGEGFSTERLRAMVPGGTTLEASDVEARLVAGASRRNPTVPVRRESVYDLERRDGEFDLVVCFEVLEHLEQPERALRELCRVARRWLLVSVPREPLWRALNLARLRYVRHLGNTPGHVQHWSRGEFIRFVSGHALPVTIRTPIPWTQVLARPRSTS